MTMVLPYSEGFVCFFALVFEVGCYFRDAAGALAWVRQWEGKEEEVPLSFPVQGLEPVSSASKIGLTA